MTRGNGNSNGSSNGNDIDRLFTVQKPLGPIAVSDSQNVNVLKALYDTRVQLHLRSEDNPPTFIVGRRGSGKTALLLSREFNPENLSVRLSADDAFAGMQAVVREVGASMFLPVEGVARLWGALLWAPIAARLVTSERRPDDPGRAYQILWQETAELRKSADGSADHALDFAAARLMEHMDRAPRIISLESLLNGFRLAERPWNDVVQAARDVLAARRTPVFVLIDSLENIGDHIHDDGSEHTKDIRRILQGLFHLVGKAGQWTAQSPVRIQCCFPSELWPVLNRVSTNPPKDFSGRLMLRWQWRDLLRVVGMRLRIFLARHYPRELRGVGADEHERLLERVLPESLTNSRGVPEKSVPYILRHTQLLPRQVLYIFGEALHQAIVETGGPHIRDKDVVNAVAEAEAVLCPEVFSAHSFRYPHAPDVGRRIIPHLPFRFNDGFLHQMFNYAGIRKNFDLNYVEMREMLTDLGIIGQFTGETEHYLHAEFAYTLDRQMTLSPDKDYCLHPLFVRHYGSPDTLPGAERVKPVYPSGVEVVSL
ncbi:P-loop ATPase, Sll1717 family [Nonomuraea candida]|uniref:P-loop ATPase, Sll1717 family n=1 Tax=Nonomuraea candida TaxID=359159 RepID=UPI0005BAA93B|nr:hypothetical protein [Nonomuraea candida]